MNLTCQCSGQRALASFLGDHLRIDARDVGLAQDPHNRHLSPKSLTALLPSDCLQLRGYHPSTMTRDRWTSKALLCHPPGGDLIGYLGRHHGGCS